MEYNQALVVVENNTYGYGILEKLIDSEYPNLYYTKKGENEYVDHFVAESLNSKSVVPRIYDKFEDKTHYYCENGRNNKK